MIDLRPITPKNHLQVRNLSVHAEQKRFVASIDKTLADAFVWQGASFRVAFEDDAPVGFILVFPFDEGGEHVVNIVRLMIDARYQGRGLGRVLLNRTLEWISSFTPTVDLVRISTLPDNEVALALYKSSGFQERGVEEGEIVLYRPAANDVNP